MHPKLRLYEQYREHCTKKQMTCMKCIYCVNCGVTQTPLWRKVQDENMCNACGIYWKTHGHHRPITMITGRYIPRKKRRESIEEPETPRNSLRRVLHNTIEKKTSRSGNSSLTTSLHLLSDMAEEMRKIELNECARNCIFFGIWEKTQ